MVLNTHNNKVGIYISITQKLIVSAKTLLLHCIIIEISNALIGINKKV